MQSCSNGSRYRTEHVAIIGVYRYEHKCSTEFLSKLIKMFSTAVIFIHYKPEI